jgi:hypothetical protein
MKTNPKRTNGSGRDTLFHFPAALMGETLDQRIEV